MIEQFVPLYVVLFTGSLAAAAAALFMTFRLHAQTVRARRTPAVRSRSRPF